MRQDRFHGRHDSAGRDCEVDGCTQAGEFRAPGDSGSSFDGPGQWRWFCLEHVRAFNAGYDFFDGMSADEILDAQSPVFGWRSASRAYGSTPGIGDAPRWADYDDPLDAISARARNIRSRSERAWREAAKARDTGITPEERRALDVLGLAIDADRSVIRRRYSQLVRQYHPDRNGGDRRHEARLRAVVDAYQVLKRASG